MRKFKFGKLVRDRIVEGIISAGNKPIWKTLSSEEYLQELKKKLLEEAQEIPKTSSDDVVKELADIQEIIDNLLEVLGISKSEFTEVQKRKNEKAGSFKNHQYIDTVEAKDDSGWVDFYLSRPDKYPEIK